LLRKASLFLFFSSFHHVCPFLEVCCCCVIVFCFYSIYSTHCIAVLCPWVMYVLFMCGMYTVRSGCYVMLCARASKERQSGKWQSFFLCFDFWVGTGEGEGGHQRDRLGRRGGKKSKQYPFFLLAFPPLRCLDRGVTLSLVRSFLISLPTSNPNPTIPLHSLTWSLPRSLACLACVVCVYDTVYPYPIPLAVVFFLPLLHLQPFPFPFPFFPTSNPSKPTYLTCPISIPPPPFPLSHPIPSQKKEVVKNVSAIFAYLDILSSGFFFLIPTSLPLFPLPSPIDITTTRSRAESAFLPSRVPFSLFQPTSCLDRLIQIT